MNVRTIWAAFIATILTTPAFAEPRPVVVELFTSQGCSSCPPADVLLTALAGRRDLLPLAFHVTYWNSLGWRDPYSSETATQRQALYAARLGGGSYTPEIVVDGRYAVIGSDRAAVLHAVSVARNDALAPIPLHVVRNGASVDIKLGPGDGRGSVLLIGYDPHRETPVGRGENNGRTLAESNIVRSMRVIAAYEGKAATISASVPTAMGIAIIVQASNGRVLAAARL